MWALGLWAMTPSLAAAQQQSPLASSLAIRRPPNEIVAQVCGADDAFRGDFVCARAASGAVTAFRRVGMRAYVAAARRGGDLYFVVIDDNTQTRFADHVWRWDLSRDAIQGLGEVGHVDEEPVRFIAGTSFGVLYRTTAGFVLHDGTRARAVAVPEGIEYASLLVHAGVTYGAWELEETTEVRSLALEGDRITWQRLGTLPGSSGRAEGRVFVTFERQGTRTAFHFLTLPGSTVTDAVVPLSYMRTALSADGASFLTWTPRSGYTIGTTTGVVTPLDRTAIPPDVVVIRPRAVAWIATGESDVWLRASASHGVVLGASGLTVRRRAPREQTACRCRGEDMACGRTGPTVAGACIGRHAIGEIQEGGSYDHTEEFERARAVPSFTGDGRFRVDRVEPDLARITRLSDGAHLWARLFDDSTLLAQRDDGTYFLADRSLESHFVVRQGTSLLTSPTSPLTTRADLYRETLVADFFAGR